VYSTTSFSRIAHESIFEPLYSRRIEFHSQLMLCIPKGIDNFEKIPYITGS